ncbi:hypothetical protein L484_001398 [Morus notabilis]|uniref:Uncharacterized protein n=1 Tax=Morus notabilis TaxID=981085 RepID=W9SCA5_9ROSA|nr:hypothetical protein L484_001398 [Morus notabilis]
MGLGKIGNGGSSAARLSDGNDREEAVEASGLEWRSFCSHGNLSSKQSKKKNR